MSRGRRSSGSSPIDADLSGRVAVVTGANRGMGKETARELARMGCTVILGCRNRERGEAAAQEINTTTGGTAIPLELDLSSLASVRSFVAASNERFLTLDVLVNNAAASLRTREVSADGFEMHSATNVLGPQLSRSSRSLRSRRAATVASSRYQRSQLAVSTCPIRNTSSGVSAASAPTAPRSRQFKC